MFAALAVTLSLGACGGEAASNSGGLLTVLAAASLAPAFQSAAHMLRGAEPDLNLTMSFAGSQQLVQNVLDGAPADVIATADGATMQRLVTAHLVDTPRPFAHNILEIAVAPGNPKHIRSLADLASPTTAVVLADPSVPAGAYAQRSLNAAGVHLIPRSFELSVTSALEKVESGDADAAIVYRTDVTSAGGAVTGVDIPAADNVEATYFIAMVSTTRNAGLATSFIANVLTGEVHRQLLLRGFLPVI